MRITLWFDAWPQEGEKLGLTVQQQNKCVVVTRILSGGLVDQVGNVQGSAKRRAPGCVAADIGRQKW